MSFILCFFPQLKVSFTIYSHICLIKYYPTETKIVKITKLERTSKLPAPAKSKSFISPPYLSHYQTFESNHTIILRTTVYPFICFPKPIHSPISPSFETQIPQQPRLERFRNKAINIQRETSRNIEESGSRLNFRFGTGINQSTLAPVRRNAIKRVFQPPFSSVFIFRNVSCRNAPRSAPMKKSLASIPQPQCWTPSLNSVGLITLIGSTDDPPRQESATGTR